MVENASLIVVCILIFAAMLGGIMIVPAPKSVRAKPKTKTSPKGKHGHGHNQGRPLRPTDRRIEEVQFTCGECGQPPVWVPIDKTVVSSASETERGMYRVMSTCWVCTAPLMQRVDAPQAFALTESGAVLEADLLKPFHNSLEDDVEHPVDAAYRTAVELHKVHP